MRVRPIGALGEPLELRRVPEPAPAAHELRVRVEAAGLRHSDVHYRSGIASAARRPITPGHEVAGVSDALGEGVIPRR